MERCGDLIIHNALSLIDLYHLHLFYTILFYKYNFRYRNFQKNPPATTGINILAPHTPGDEAATINIEKLTKIARWMYATGFTISNLQNGRQWNPAFSWKGKI
ncbi:hypothetical protein [Chitinophaga sp. ARDCPP14]|uniref:hypothetical protein n=1 Tax=Chitinophaga sp. ARDCPP14 TaxID=3391139 RepID=UPI003F51E46F